MNPLQENHLLNIIKHFDYLVTKKYRAGAVEHGGNLWQKDTSWVLDQAIDEAIDQVVYLLTLKDQLKKINPPEIDGNGNLSLNEE